MKNKWQIPNRPGDSNTLLNWISLLLCVIISVLILVFNSPRPSKPSNERDGLIFLAVLAFLAWRSFKQHRKLEREGWWEHIDVEAPAVPCEFFGETYSRRLGAKGWEPIRDRVEFFEDRVVIEPGGAAAKEMLFNEIKGVGVTQEGGVLELRRSPHGYYTVANGPTVFYWTRLQKFGRVAVLKLLRQLAPEANFDTMAEHMEQGNVPRIG